MKSACFFLAVLLLAAAVGAADKKGNPKTAPDSKDKDYGAELPRMTGVAFALLGTIGLLSLLGLRYPLQMIPLLLFELIWKAIWLAAFAGPRWLDGTLDEGMRSTIFDTSLGLVLILVIPWRYVWANYVARPGDPWTLRPLGGERTTARPAP